MHDLEQSGDENGAETRKALRLKGLGEESWWWPCPRGGIEKEQANPKSWTELSAPARDGLALMVGGLVLAISDLGAPMDLVVGITDAGEEGGGACESPRFPGGCLHGTGNC